MSAPTTHRLGNRAMHTLGLRPEFVFASRFPRGAAPICPPPSGGQVGSDSPNPSASQRGALGRDVVPEPASATEEQVSAATFRTPTEAHPR
jgi:hypothetical protein